MCLKIGASVLIDDNWNYCHEVCFEMDCYIVSWNSEGAYSVWSIWMEPKERNK